MVYRVEISRMPGRGGGTKGNSLPSSALCVSFGGNFAYTHVRANVTSQHGKITFTPILFAFYTSVSRLVKRRARAEQAKISVYMRARVY